MGIFTNNTHYGVGGVDYGEQLPALEGYDAVGGCAMAMLEVQQNDLELFKGIIAEDCKEAIAVNEGYEVINESAKDILNKLKEIFMKLLQKIKGIFKAFIAKLTSTIGPGKQVYNKYVKQISQYHNWDGFTVKNFRKPLEGDGRESIKKVSKYNNFEYIVSNGSSAGLTAAGITYDKMKSDDSLDTDEINAALIKTRLSDELKNVVDDDFKNMNEEFMNAVFDDAEDKDEWTAGEIITTYAGNILKEGDKFKTLIEDIESNLSKTISKVINQLDKEAKKVYDYTGDLNIPDKKNNASYTSQKISASFAASNNDKRRGSVNVSDNTKKSGQVRKYDSGYNNAKALNNTVGKLQKIATQEQTLITSLNSATMNATKFLLSQARRVWSSAAAYSSREHKNEGYEFYSAIGEATAYDFMTDMEAIG